MVTFVLTVEEDQLNGKIEANGTVVGLKGTKAEEELVGGLIVAIEEYCVKERMPIAGGEFLRTAWPAPPLDNGNPKKRKRKK